MTTSSTSQQLEILGEKDTLVVANVAGLDNPVAILGNKVLDQLAALCRKAKAEATKAGDGASAALELCTTLDGMLKACAHIRDEYYDRIEIERERDEAESRLMDASSALQKPSP